MLPKSILRRDRLVGPILTALAVAVAATKPTASALAAGPTVQIQDFYFPDGSQVLSDGGMPFAHAALRRSPGDRDHLADHDPAGPASHVLWHLDRRFERRRGRRRLPLVGGERQVESSGRHRRERECGRRRPARSGRRPLRERRRSALPGDHGLRWRARPGCMFPVALTPDGSAPSECGPAHPPTPPLSTRPGPSTRLVDAFCEPR